MRPIRMQSSGSGTGRLTVPKALAARIPDDVRFVPEVTEDGILFRAVRGASDTRADDPKWMKGSAPKAAPKAKPAAKQAAKAQSRKQRPLKNPDADATPSQTWAIFVGTKVDVRPLKLTMGEASAIIDRSKNGAISVAEMNEWVERGAIDHRGA